MFDSYTLKARLLPILILFFPIVIVGSFYSFEFESIIYILTSLGLMTALTFLFSQLGRDRGKKKEPALWQKWNGVPSTQILRWANTQINEFTKQRYHSKLQSLCPVPIIPDKSFETNNPDSADNVYQTWTKYLITQTRDSKRFPLLLRENTNYGFRRNLWGLKPIAITIILLLLSINYFYWNYKLRLLNPMAFPDNFKLSTLVLLVCLLFWTIVITASWIRPTAFSYAERLLETTENL